MRIDVVMLAETIREGDSRGETGTDDGESEGSVGFFVPQLAASVCESNAA